MVPIEDSDSKVADRDDIGHALSDIVSAVPGVRHIYPAHGRAAALVTAVIDAVPGLPLADRAPVAVGDDTVTISIGVAEALSAPEVARAVSRAVADYLAEQGLGATPRVVVTVSSIG